MAINIELEELGTLGFARRNWIPRTNGKEIAPSTGWRWIHRGVRARDDRLIKLEIVYVGGRPMTSRQAIQRFFNALTAGHQTAADSERSATPVRTVATEQRLLEAGLLPPETDSATEKVGTEVHMQQS